MHLILVVQNQNMDNSSLIDEEEFNAKFGTFRRSS